MKLSKALEPYSRDKRKKVNRLLARYAIEADYSFSEKRNPDALKDLRSALNALHDEVAVDQDIWDDLFQSIDGLPDDAKGPDVREVLNAWAAKNACHAPMTPLVGVRADLVCGGAAKYSLKRRYRGMDWRGQFADIFERAIHGKLLSSHDDIKEMRLSEQYEWSACNLDADRLKGDPAVGIRLRRWIQLFSKREPEIKKRPGYLIRFRLRNDEQDAYLPTVIERFGANPRPDYDTATLESRLELCVHVSPRYGDIVTGKTEKVS